MTEFGMSKAMERIRYLGMVAPGVTNAVMITVGAWIDLM